MATVTKVLGQLAPGPSTVSAVYTVPSGKSAVVSTLVAAETGGAPSFVQVFVGVNGASAITASALLYGVPLEANAHLGVTEGWTLGPGDVLYAGSTTGNVTFTLFGEESDVPA